MFVKRVLEMDELIELIKQLKTATANWNAKCKRRFYFHSVTLPGDKFNYQRYGDGLVGVVNRADLLIDRLLITEKGQSNLFNQELLEKEAGIKVVVLEQDSFGPVRQGIVIGYGVLCYG